MNVLRRMTRKSPSSLKPLLPTTARFVPTTTFHHARHLQSKTDINDASTSTSTTATPSQTKDPNDVESHFIHPELTVEQEVAAANEEGAKQGWEIRLLPSGNGHGVYSTRAFKTNDLLIESKVIGEAPQRDKYSVQVDWDKHVYITLPARFLNHCCFPNLKLKDNEYGSFSFYAAKDIKPNEELTWDYQTSEFISISVPMAICTYNNKQCRGKSVGFKYMAEELRSLHGDYIAGYLKNWKP